MITSVVLAGFLAMGPHWGIADIPYPEVSNPSESVECRIAATLAGYARSKSAAFRKDDLSSLRIEGPRATARLTFPNRVETVYLERLGDEWRVMRVE